MPNAKQPQVQSSGDQSGQKKKTSGEFRKFDFITPYLGQDDKQWLRDHYDNLPVIVCNLVEQLASHHRFSLKRDESSGRWLAVLFDDSGEKSEPGTAMSVRGATPIDAIYALAYLHIYRFPEGWSSKPLTDDNDPWG